MIFTLLSHNIRVTPVLNVNRFPFFFSLLLFPSVLRHACVEFERDFLTITSCLTRQENKKRSKKKKQEKEKEKKNGAPLVLYFWLSGLQARSNPSSPPSVLEACTLRIVLWLFVNICR